MARWRSSTITARTRTRRWPSTFGASAASTRPRRARRAAGWRRDPARPACGRRPAAAPAYAPCSCRDGIDPPAVRHDTARAAPRPRRHPRDARRASARARRARARIGASRHLLDLLARERDALVDEALDGPSAPRSRADACSSRNALTLPVASETPSSISSKPSILRAWREGAQLHPRPPGGRREGRGRAKPRRSLARACGRIVFSDVSATKFQPLIPNCAGPAAARAGRRREGARVGRRVAGRARGARALARATYGRARARGTKGARASPIVKNVLAVPSTWSPGLREDRAGDRRRASSRRRSRPRRLQALVRLVDRHERAHARRGRGGGARRGARRRREAAAALKHSRRRSASQP